MEITFNYYNSKAFAVASSSVSFYRLPDENLSGAESVSPQLFLTKDIDVNADVRVRFNKFCCVYVSHILMSKSTFVALVTMFCSWV